MNLTCPFDASPWVRRPGGRLWIRQLVLALCLAGAGHMASGQQAEVVSLEKLQALIAGKDRPVQVINFWATWCAPCVKEMPMLEKLNQENTDVGVTLVSMDLDLDPNPQKVFKFVERKKLQSRVVILDARNPNTYIDKIDKNWSGALPATLVINSSSGKRKLHEGELREGDLEKMIAEIK